MGGGSPRRSQFVLISLPPAAAAAAAGAALSTSLPLELYSFLQARAHSAGGAAGVQLCVCAGESGHPLAARSLQSSTHACEQASKQANALEGDELHAHHERLQHLWHAATCTRWRRGVGGMGGSGSRRSGVEGFRAGQCNEREQQKPLPQRRSLLTAAPLASGSSPAGSRACARWRCEGGQGRGAGREGRRGEGGSGGGSSGARARASDQNSGSPQRAVQHVHILFLGLALGGLWRAQPDLQPPGLRAASAGEWVGGWRRGCAPPSLRPSLPPLALRPRPLHPPPSNHQPTHPRTHPPGSRCSCCMRRARGTCGTPGTRPPGHTSWRRRCSARRSQC